MLPDDRPTKKPRKTFFRILAFLSPYRRQFIIGTLLALAFSVTNGISLYSVVPLFNTLTPGTERYQIHISEKDQRLLSGERPAELMERVNYHKASVKLSLNHLFQKTEKFTLLLYICGGLFVVIIIRVLLELAVVYFIGYAGYGAITDIRRAVYNALINLPLSFFHRRKTGTLISNIIYDTDLVSGALSNQLRKFVINVFIVITHLSLLLYLNTNLTLGAIGMLVLITIPITIMGRSFKRYTDIEQDKTAEISSMVVETVAGIRIIKSHRMEGFQLERFTKTAQRLFAKVYKKSLVDILRPHVIEIVASFFVVFLLIGVGSKVLSGEYSKGEFLFYILTFLFLIDPLKQIANMNNQVKQAESAGERIFGVIDEPHEIPPDERGADASLLPLIAPKEEIRFSGVSFKYTDETEYVLRDISISVPAGARIAIVGRSGAGKTTLVDLVPRFYSPSAGSISIDGVDIATYPLKQLRNSIGIVTQDVFLFNGTIAENIAYGHREFSRDRVEEAARMANAHDFISRLPNGYETVIGERGITLSGGERQRVAIARSILRNPPILILDEATSSLDTESERLVQGALERLMNDRTSFVIAHRLSTVTGADRIIVLERGAIVETGTHDELLAKGGIYKSLYEIQFADTPERAAREEA
ncbi:MAG TPA: ABC transporter transmembrane domain-containing protein [Spirochaetota bacterium]|nr:ABC transporter transmembrane domain-containing protein [Spirochaetota bacterium]HNT10386.1 ABC transporter transmembrane domain-containing protein [Spirochaetota bacterium]